MLYKESVTVHFNLNNRNHRNHLVDHNAKQNARRDLSTNAFITYITYVYYGFWDIQLLVEILYELAEDSFY